MNTKFVNRLFTGALAVTTTILSIALPARAASSDCTLLLTASECSTAPVRADPTHHFVHITVSQHLTYKVVDVANGVVVAKGTSGGGEVNQTIFGLYSSYRLYVSNPITSILIGGSGLIHNE